MPAWLRSRRCNKPWCKGGRGQQAGNRGVFRRELAVADDQQRSPVGNRPLRRIHQFVQRLAQRAGRVRRIGGKQGGQRDNLEVVAIGRSQPIHILVREDRMGELQLPAVFRCFVQQVPLLAGKRHQRHHQPLAQRVDRRVGHLGEELLEVAEQQLRAAGEHGQRRVGAHRADGLLTVGRHRGQHHLQLLAGVAEATQLLRKFLAIDRRRLRRLKQPAQLDTVLFQPSPVGLLPRNLALDLVVDNDPALFRIDQEHAAGLKTAFLANSLGRKLDHAHFARQHDEPVGRHHVAAGPQAVAVQGAANESAVGKHHGRRSVPRLHDRGVVLVERPLVGRNVIALPERLGNHHHQCMRRRAAGADQQLHGVVETGRVASARLKHREQLRHILDERGTVHALFPPLQPISVAAQGIDFAVVGDHAERLGQPPARKRVRAITLVDDGTGPFARARRTNRGNKRTTGARETCPCRQSCGKTSRARRTHRPTRALAFVQSSQMLNPLCGRYKAAAPSSSSARAPGRR